MNMKNEPVRLIAVITGVLSAAGTCLISISSGAPIPAAVGTAVLTLSVVLGGGEVARSKVTPTT